MKAAMQIKMKHITGTVAKWRSPIQNETIWNSMAAHAMVTMKSRLLRHTAPCYSRRRKTWGTQSPMTSCLEAALEMATYYRYLISWGINIKRRHTGNERSMKNRHGIYQYRMRCLIASYMMHLYAATTILSSLITTKSSPSMTEILP